MPVVVLSVVFFDFTLPVTGVRAFTTLLLLPINEAEVDNWITVALPLYLKTFMTDPDIVPIPFIGPILYLCPLLTPNAYVFALVMLPVLHLAESIWSNSPGGNNDMYMWIVLRRIVPIKPPMDGGNRTQPTVHKIIFNKITHNPNQLPRWQFVG